MLHSQECLLPFNSVTIIVSIRASNYCELNDVLLLSHKGRSPIHVVHTVKFSTQRRVLISLKVQNV